MLYENTTKIVAVNSMKISEVDMSVDMASFLLPVLYF